MTNPVEQALERALRAVWAKEGNPPEAYEPPDEEIIGAILAFFAAFLRSIASAPTPEMIAAGALKLYAEPEVYWQQRLVAAWSVMATALADQVEDRHG